MSTILVTGGAGYIGSQTVYNLLDKGYQVIVLDNLSNGHAKNLPTNIQLLNLDLRNREELEKALGKLDFQAVIHFAASPAINNDTIENFTGYYENNFIGTLNLAQVLSKIGVKKVVFSSTAATYGNPTSLPILESQPKDPLNMYGNTKRMSEIMWTDLARLDNFKVTIVRYFNACGADLQLRTGESHTPETHLIPIILEVAAGLREKLIMFGQDYETKDGSCVRDYIHVADLASAHIKALEYMDSQEPGYCEAFNLGTGVGYSNLEIIETVKRITGKQIPLEIGPRRPGDWDSAYADNSKAKTVLNWTPQHSDLETIISSAWKWLIKDKNLKI